MIDRENESERERERVNLFTDWLFMWQPVIKYTYSQKGEQKITIASSVVESANEKESIILLSQEKNS